MKKWFFLSCFSAVALFGDSTGLSNNAVPKSVAGIGYSTIDLLVQVDDSFIENHISKQRGSDNRCCPEKLDAFLKEMKLEPKYVPGGKTANTLKALSKLGEKCAFVGQVGQDSWGEIFTDNLHRYGIHDRLCKTHFTSRILCLIAPDGERTFWGYDVPTLSSPSEKDFEDAKWLHIESLYFENNDYIEKAVQIAKAKGIPVSLELSSGRTIEQYRERILSLLSSIEIVFCNEDEIQVLFGLNPEEGCKKLQQLCKTAVVTLGEKGCLIGNQGNQYHVTGYPSEVIDTTGAGDYFAAGFIWGYLNNLSLVECGGMGNCLGSSVCEVIGTELSDEKWAKVQKCAEAVISVTKPAFK